jgi:hypothetical protein
MLLPYPAHRHRNLLSEEENKRIALSIIEALNTRDLSV